MSCRVSMGHGGKPWVSDFNDPNYIAGRNAMKTGMHRINVHALYRFSFTQLNYMYVV